MKFALLGVASVVYVAVMVKLGSIRRACLNDPTARIVPTAEWVGLDVDEETKARWVTEFEPPTIPVPDPETETTDD